MYTRMLVEVLSQNLTNGSTNISIYILPIISTISALLLIHSLLAVSSVYYLLEEVLIDDIVDTLILTVVRISVYLVLHLLVYHLYIKYQLRLYQITNRLQQSIRILLGHECNCDQMSLSSRYISSIRSHLQTYS